jgi:uncharacterized protein
VLRRVLSTLVAAVALLQPASPTFAYELVAVPALTGRVIDQTGTLSAAERADLDNRLAALERRKGSQIAVLVVATVRPESIEQYAIRVAETWKLGRKGVDDGLLLVVAKDDREVRIEVGYGLEGAIPDATANRVIDEYLVPAFRAGDYARGIGAAVDRLIALVDGEPLPEPPAESAGGRGDLLPFIFMLAVVAGVSGATWLLIGALGITLLMALVGFVVGMSAGGRRAGWVSRGRGGFGGGFGARSGGGFSGGGGGFGGGGASGRW